MGSEAGTLAADRSRAWPLAKGACPKGHVGYVLAMARECLPGGHRPRRTLTALACAFASVGIASSASAVPITFAFTGEVVALSNEAVDGPIAIGDPISGQFSFESSAANTSTDPEQGAYASLLRVSFSFGVYSNGYDEPPQRITTVVVANDRAIGIPSNVRDSYLVQTQGRPGGPLLNGLELREFHFQLTDPTATAFDSLDQPLTPPPLDAFTVEDVGTSFITVGFASAGRPFSQVRGRVTSLTLVPEPGSGTLLALGLLAAARRRRTASPG